ncbi:MAG TPA: phospho-sugar mutase [Bacteroidales bacterium]|nr:phospho-sugar mutase [Bacteroidales bacterium]
MPTKPIDPKILERANRWLQGNIDDETREQIKYLIENDPDELTESFYCDLEFGTGGLRGIMGPGTNRMNRYTVGMATQGLANYLKSIYPNEEELRVAIAYDSRNNSELFAKVSSLVLSANGIHVFLFEGMRPTPELSFAVRYLHCHSGIVITASHNPRDYNGYKVYWNDGAQLIPPHDKNVIAEVQKITSIDDVKFSGDSTIIDPIGEFIDTAYLQAIMKYSLAPELIEKHKDLNIVYTPLHGTGITLVPPALTKFGFENVNIVKEQAVASGNFPTIYSPNPEEKSAMEMALLLAEKVGAELILATDPDADRIGVGVKDTDGNYILLNGNQTASILTYYLVKQWQAAGRLTGNEFIVKTIVTSELMGDIARSAGVEVYECLTGFKWIADVIRRFEGQKTYIGGGEESFGYLIGDDVRDKDAIVACCIFAECAAWAKEKGMSLYELLIDIYREYGLYKESLVNVVRKGISGQSEIRAMMENYRGNPPAEIAGKKVVMIKDYLSLTSKDMVNGAETPIVMPKSDVLQFFLADGSKVSVRPSGTEPKIKFYFSVKEPFNDGDHFKEAEARADERIGRIVESLGLK